MSERIVIHPDQALGPEESLYRAGEEVWLEAIKKEERCGNKSRAEQIASQQFRRDEDGNIFIEIGSEKVILGHISYGWKILAQLINNLQNSPS